NEVESKVLYSMKNGKIYCMVNRYILSKKYGRWHFVKKIYKKCKNFVQKRKNLPYPLP
ncbi:MAG: hypothetical protein GXO02_01815, partial [Epsilonproteobacteria bacterium]|nr:hypothetical protein [Campylobacterota bacterium]